MSRRIDFAKSERLRAIAEAFLIWIWDEQDRVKDKPKLVELKIMFEPRGSVSIRCTRFEPPKGFVEHTCKNTPKLVAIKGIFHSYTFRVFSDTDLYKGRVTLSHDPTPAEIESAGRVLKEELGNRFIPYTYADYEFDVEATISGPVKGRVSRSFDTEEEAMEFMKTLFHNSSEEEQRTYIDWRWPNAEELEKRARIVGFRKE